MTHVLQASVDLDVMIAAVIRCITPFRELLSVPCQLEFAHLPQLKNLFRLGLDLFPDLISAIPIGIDLIDIALMPVLLHQRLEILSILLELLYLLLLVLSAC